MDKRVLTLNTACFAVSFAAWVMLGPAALSLAAEFELTGSQTAWLRTAPILLGSLLRIPVGLLSEWQGVRRTFPAVLLVSAAGLLWIARASTRMDLTVGVVALGVAGTSFVVGVQAISERTGREHLGKALGIFGAGNAGTALSTLLVPAALGLVGWRTTCDLYAGALCLSAFWYAVTPQTAPAHRDQPTLRELLAPLADWRAWLLGLCYGATFGGLVAAALTLTDLFATRYTLSPALAGASATVLVLTGSLARIPGGWASDHWGSGPVLIGSLAVMSVGFGVISAGPSLWVVLASAVVAGLAMGFGMTACLRLVPRWFPGRVGPVGGLVGTLGGLGGFALPWAAEWLGDPALPIAGAAAFALLVWLGLARRASE